MDFNRCLRKEFRTNMNIPILPVIRGNNRSNSINGKGIGNKIAARTSVCTTDVPIPSTDDFLNGCLTGERLVNQTRTRFTYNASLVSRAVHLFRDPFDNLVARMHLAVDRRRKQLGWSEDSLANFTNNRNGLLAWCNFVDTNHRSEFFAGFRAA